MQIFLVAIVGVIIFTMALIYTKLFTRLMRQVTMVQVSLVSARILKSSIFFKKNLDIKMEG